MIDTVINYSSIDFRFLESNIRECLKFSDNVIIPVCDHLFDGTPEDREILNKSFDLLFISPKIKFVEYAWDKDKNAKFHHNMSRWLSLRHVKSEYVLFLDADEQINGDVMKEYLESGNYKNYDVVALECYWYFREPVYRATTTEMAGVIYRTTLCEPPMIFHKEERWAYRDRGSELRVKEHETYNNQVMCNHYSWVRSKEEMLKKVKAWAHSTEKNWVQLVEDEFNRPFNGTDFIHGYQFEVVENKLDKGEVQ